MSGFEQAEPLKTMKTGAIFSSAADDRYCSERRLLLSCLAVSDDLASAAGPPGQ
jgi:hypothetical protein